MNNNEDMKLIWLSHVLTKHTPAYGGGEGMRIEHEKQINCGDSCNTAKLAFSNHLGSHVDAPRHFIESGITTESYEPQDWIFIKPLVINSVMALPTESHNLPDLLSLSINPSISIPLIVA